MKGRALSIKKVFIVFLCAYFALVSPCIAESGVTPQSDTNHYYEHEILKDCGTVREFRKYYCDMWAYYSEFSIPSSVTYSLAIDISGIVGSVLKSAVKSSGLFTLTITSHPGSGTIHADESRLSNLGIYDVYHRYNVEQFYVIDFGATTSRTSKGTATVDEPVRVEAIVVYDD